MQTAKQLRIRLLRLKHALSDLGPEGIAETQLLSELMRGLAARTRGLRRMLSQGADPTFRRLLKQTGMLDGARNALKETLAAKGRLEDVVKVFGTAERAFVQQLRQQAPDLLRVFEQVQKSEGA